MAGILDADAAQTPLPPSPLELALATATLRIADKIPALGLSVQARASRSEAAEIALDGLPELGLTLMVDAPRLPGEAASTAEGLAQKSGAVIFDGTLIDSLIEVQTIGRIDGPARPPRRPTRIDAALVQPFAQGLIEQTALLLPRDHWGPRPGRLRAGTYLAGTGSLPIVATATTFLRVTVDVTLADGARKGTITLLLPDSAGQQDLEDDAKLVHHDPGWAARMDAVGQSASVRMEAVLPPVRMTLAELVALKPGDLIEVEGQALQDLRLMSGSLGVGGTGRQKMPHGVRIGARLGQLDGARALRIQNCPNDREEAGASGMEEHSGRHATSAPALVPEVSPAGGTAPRLPRGEGEAGYGLPTTTVNGTDPKMASMPAGSDRSDLPDFGPLPDLPDLP